MYETIGLLVADDLRPAGRPSWRRTGWRRFSEAHLVSLIHSGEYSTAEVAGLFGVGRSTVYRAIERQRAEARAATTTKS